VQGVGLRLRARCREQQRDGAGDPHHVIGSFWS
jgi:hypothetical protein